MYYVRSRLLPHSPVYMEVPTIFLPTLLYTSKQTPTSVGDENPSSVPPSSVQPPSVLSPSIPPPSVLLAPSPHNPSSGTSPQCSSVTATLANVSSPSTTNGVPPNTTISSQTLGSIPAHTRASFWDHLPRKPLQILHQMLNRTYSNNYPIYHT